MLNDPMFLTAVSPDHGTLRGSLASTAPVHNRTQVAFRVRDLAPGKSVRVGSDTVLLPGKTQEVTISHSSTKENAPYDTLRSVIRLDVKSTDNNGAPITTSAYLVVVAPQRVSGQETVGLETAQTLLATCLFGPRIDKALPPDSANTVPNFLERVLAGEP